MIHNYILKSNRITLKQVSHKDLDSIISWRNNENIRKWFFNTKQLTKPSQLIWYESYLKKANDIMFTIYETIEINQPIGIVSLYNIKNTTSEFGRFLIGDFKARGKGIGLEVVQLICDFAFNTLGLKQITLDVVNNNISAITIYKKCGFKVVSSYIVNKSKVLYMELNNL